MPVDERTFASDVAGWVNEILRNRPNLPFGRASVEEHVEGTPRRHDFRLYRRHTDTPVLTGEIKMPDSIEGKHPLNALLVEDALTKASVVGVRYCFTWNVRQFVLFDSHIQNVPYAERYIEGPRDVVDVVVSDDVSNEAVRRDIRDFWEYFLQHFADLLEGRRGFDLAPLDQRFVAWLEGALEDAVANTEDILALRWRSDADFKDRLTSWMLSQGWEPSSQEEQLRRNFERASRLACYILVTRLVFYQVLRRRFTVLPHLSIDGVETSQQLKDVLDARFNDAVRYSHDYETVFVPEDDDLGWEIPFLSPTAPMNWARLVRRVEEFDFSNLDFDVIGQMYERLIHPNERRRFGQFYTSPDVVDLINAFCIREPETRVLDPACGGGTFLVRAYARKRVLNQDRGKGADHQQLLGEIFGIDIGAFPAQLSTINLAVRHLSNESNYPRVARASFFDAQSGVPLYDIPLTGESVRSIALDKLDAVVGNPPYIRQEKIDRFDKQHYARLFEKQWPKHRPLSGRSDIYAYFFTHAAHLLNPGGYLGFVTSIGWLDTEYGFRLQEFFLRNFRIVAVIESQVEKWFEDARVTTAVTILRREPEPAERADNLVRFIQLKKPLAEIYSQALDRPLSDEGEAARQADMDAVRDLIEEIREDQNTDYWRVHVRSQRELWDEGSNFTTDEDDAVDAPGYRGGKWGQYVRAPDIWFDLKNRAADRMVPLQDMAVVRFGFKTGADKFFCVRDVTQRYLDRIPDPQEFRRRWGISRKDTRRIRIVRDGENVEHLVERRFLEPELHSLMEVKRAVVRSDDVGRMVINASVPRSRLRRTHFAKYVAYAEREGWHTGSTIASRAQSRPWFDLGLRPKSERADMFWTKSQQYRHVVPLNSDRLPTNSNLYDVWPHSGIPAKVLWAVLNSTVAALAKYQFGRSAGVEGNLKTEVVDVNMMLVPDIRESSPEVAQRAIAACENMAQRLAGRYLSDEFDLDDRRELDDAVLEMLGIDDYAERTALRERLYQAITDMHDAIRAREVIAQKDRRRAKRRTSVTALDIAKELWRERRSDLHLLQFPDDFVPLHYDGETFSLPDGDVEVGAAMIAMDGLLQIGTLRVGGKDGEVLQVSSHPRARFIEALSECHRSGDILLPGDDICDQAVSRFTQYRDELRERCSQIAARTTRNKSRQNAIVDTLMRKALQWRRD